ncbi:PD-(D/E)XK motif protein [Alkalibacillus haloalkaliphilus]|uniref:PD-(D/E)XK motif protein n=1 Tax=Alkalibacillus haloalkaliphilus TaxID=94136 RepID=A0A511W8R2_9BACI|nr:PD-(D/E)XK motif protein [Alkalibacillus haloalkaliphilus]GEN46738.1 hypothetical protein AHA02nite_25140 [Alkalibacillus haloalkaliphilus]
MLEPPKNLWLEMESEIARSKKKDGVVERLQVWAGEVCMYIGLHANTRKRMLTVSIPVQMAPNPHDIPETKGYNVELYKSIRGDSYIDITLTVTKKEYMEFFETLTMDLIRRMDKITDEVIAVRTFIKRLTKWQQFLARKVSLKLTEEQQRGLLAELYLIKLKVNAGIDKALVINGWIGPEGANRDFSYNRLEVEVKTSLYRANEKVKIANEFQLDENRLNHLYMYHLSLEKTPNCGVTLPSLVNEVKDLFQTDPFIYQRFNDKLDEWNYDDLHDLSYDTSYEIRKESVFEVKGRFPRILPSEMRQGVSGVSYSINLVDCEDYLVNKNEMLVNIT